MAEKPASTDQVKPASEANCSVNMTMNFVIGAVAVAVALVLVVWLLSGS